MCEQKLGTVVMCCEKQAVKLFIFFFQAEDGIRDKLVTGVQTCALPIYARPNVAGCQPESRVWCARQPRSEERRVGKSVDLGGRRIIKKKKRNSMENLLRVKQHKHRKRPLTLLTRRDA